MQKFIELLLTKQKLYKMTAKFKSQKEDFGPRGHLTDYLPTSRGQLWTFD